MEKDDENIVRAFRAYADSDMVWVNLTKLKTICDVEKIKDGEYRVFKKEER